MKDMGNAARAAKMRNVAVTRHGIDGDFGKAVGGVVCFKAEGGAE